MFLRSIHVENVRGLADVELDFHDAAGVARQWTVLLGANGSGKSNLLKAIALVTAGSEAAAELAGDFASWVRVGKGSRRAKVSAVLQNQELEERPVAIEFRRDDTITPFLTRNAETLEALDAALKHSQRNYFVAAYGASRRLSDSRGLSREKSQYRSLRAQSVATLFDPNRTLVPFENWVMDLDYRTKGSGLKLVRSISKEFLPGVVFHRVDREKQRLLFRTSDGLVPLELLSEGYQNVIAWVGDLLSRLTKVFTNYRNPLEARGLLLIDEVDLHLHAIWQRRLLEFLQRKLPNFQFVVTTHSPLTAQQTGVGELYYLERADDGVHLREFAGEPRRLLLHQLLMSDAFGVSSDESRQQQAMKDSYRQLRDKSGKTAAEKRHLETLAAAVRELPDPIRTNSLVNEETLSLLRKIESELVGGRP